MDSAAYFDAVATEWDAMRTAFFSDEVREVALRIAGVAPGESAADLGAGTGFLTEALLTRGLRVIAVDHSAEMLDQMKRKFAGAPGLQLRQGESERLPIGDAAVDHVFANMYLHHVEDPAAAIREMARVLTPNGTLVITDLNEHRYEYLRTEQHDRWLGFRHEDVLSWLRAAGLVDPSVRGIGQECRSGSSCGGERTAIGIFAASARKAARS